MWIHRVSGALIMVITLIMGIMAFNHQYNTIDSQVHTIVGFALMIITVLIVVGGVFTRSMMNRLRWRTPLIIKIKRSHQIFGHLMIMAGQVSILTGGLKYALWVGVSQPLEIVHVCVFFAVIVIIETINQKYIRSDDIEFEVPKDTMTIE